MSVDATTLRWGLTWFLSVCIAVAGGAFWAGGIDNQSASQQQQAADQRELTQAWLETKFAELNSEVQNLADQVKTLETSIGELRREQVKLRERVASLEGRTGN